jgi:hypothetical protein
MERGWRSSRAWIGVMKVRVHNAKSRQPPVTLPARRASGTIRVGCLSTVGGVGAGALSRSQGLFQHPLVGRGQQLVRSSRGHPAEQGQAGSLAPTLGLASTTETNTVDSGGLGRSGDHRAQHEQANRGE